MDRNAQQELHRGRLGIATLVSIAAHVGLLAWLTVDVPGVEEPERIRTTQLIQLADTWQNQPLEVVQLRGQTSASTDEGLATTIGAEEGTRSRVAESEARAAALVVEPVLPGVPARATGLSLAPAEGVAQPTVILASTRGVVKRRGEDANYGVADFEFEPASEAAREAERRRSGGGVDGTDSSGGIGVTISGGDCGTPGAVGIPVVGGRGGGLGRVPGTSPGRGLIGRLSGAPNGSLINRVTPGRRIP